MNEEKVFHKFYRTIIVRIKDPKVLVSLFIAGIMILSTLGVILDYQSGGSNKMEYNGYKFEQMYDGIQTKINGQKFILTYFPEQLEHINVSAEAKQMLKNMQVFAITYDTESEYKESFAEQQFNLAEKLAIIDKYVISGVTNNTGMEQIPVITCSNATNVMPVILFQEGITTNMTLKNNCLTINIGSMYEAPQAGDLLFYQITGVMN